MHPVYYEPSSKPNDNGEACIGLFANPNGSIKDEPMLGEVLFNRLYNVEKDESKNKLERETIQRQDLYKFWRYLETKDAEEAADIEDEITAMGMKRQNAFLLVAKDWRRTDTKVRAARRSRREGQAVEAGLAPEEAEINSDVSDDSAYESDEEEEIRQRAKKGRGRGNMPPPPVPAPGNKSNKKRKSNDGAGGKGKKKSKSVKDSEMYGSGGLGDRGEERVGRGGRDQSIDRLNGRYESLEPEYFNPDPPQSDDGPPTPGPMASPMRGHNYTRRLIETNGDSSDVDTRARQRGTEQQRGGSVDSQAEYRRGMREASAAAREQGLQDFSGRFGTGRVLGSVTSNRESSRNNERDQTPAGQGHFQAHNGGLEYNNGLNEMAGVQRAIRNSMAPESPSARDGRHNGSLSNDDINRMLDGGSLSRGPSETEEEEEGMKGRIEGVDNGSQSGTGVGQTETSGEDGANRGDGEHGVDGENGGDGEAEGPDGEAEGPNGEGHRGDDSGAWSQRE